MIRKFLPWLFACGWLVAFLLFLQVLSLQSILDSPGKDDGLPVRLLPHSTVGEKLISTLGFFPSTQTVDAHLVASVIENHEDARPHQRGLKEAIAVFEFIVEGDITRFLAFFREDRLPEQVGPVRSLREYMVSLALGYKPLLLHAGGHPFAYDALKWHPELIHHDGIRYDGETYERDPEGTPPHNLFMRRAPLQSVIEKHDIPLYQLPLFKGKSHKSKVKSTSAKKITIGMGSPLHDVTFLYKPLFGVYTRSTAGAAKQAQPKTIALLEAYVDGFNQPGYIPWTKTYGGGKMLLFREGRVFEGTWQREKGEPLEFLDADGTVLPVAKGQVWITFLPSLAMASWEEG